MKRLLLLSLLVLFVTSQANAYKKLSIEIPVNGKNRNMVVFTPNTFPEKSPLFIVTHGMNQNPEYQYGSDKMYEMIDTAKFVVTYLRSDGSTWDIWGTNDQTFVIKAILHGFDASPPLHWQHAEQDCSLCAHQRHHAGRYAVDELQ